MAGRLFPAGGAPSILLVKPVLVIGRAPVCDIHLDQPFVSNRHCVLRFADFVWNVEDLRSRNGITVNDRPVTKHYLEPGDTLTIAKKLRFVIEYDSVVETQRFTAMGDVAERLLRGDDRRWDEHGPATKRLEPHDKDVWSRFEG